MKQRRVMLVIAWCVLAGCKCQCSRITLGLDGGNGGNGGSGGNGGGNGAGMGGGAAGGGSGGGGVVWGDGGDGTTITPTGPANGGPAFSLDGGDNSSGTGVKLDPSGYIVLNTGSSEFYYMWIANDSNG